MNNFDHVWKMVIRVIQMKEVLTVTVVLFALNAEAQQRSQQVTEWQFPKNVVELCKEVENSLIQTYRMEIEANRVSVNGQVSPIERSDASTLSDAAKKFQRIHEERWYKLGCVNLLYKR
jgi:hypothetical protein